MKRFFCVLLSCILMVSLIGGCSSKPASGSAAPADGSSSAAPKTVYKLNLSVPDPDTSSVTVAAKEFARRLNEKSDGVLDIQVYPNGSLYGGDGSAAVKQLAAGSLDMLVLAGSLYANFVPEFNVISIPYMFDDFDQLVDFVNSDVGTQLKGGVSNIGIEPLALWTRSFRQITNSKRPITQPDDLKGVVLRVPNNALWVEFFTACGATATPMSFSEVYNALQLKTLDGQENPVDVPVSAKFYEVQKYITISNHMADTWVVGMNPDKLKTLPADMQELIKTTAAEMQQWKIDYDAKEDSKALEELKSQGMEANTLTAEEQAKFVEVSKSLYDSVFKGIVKNDELFNKALEFVGKK